MQRVLALSKKKIPLMPCHTVAVHSTGSFCLRTPACKIDGISAKHCVLAQQSPGDTFSSKPALPPPAKAGGIRALGVL